MNSIINDKIIKYLELIDENIIVMDNFINITEKVNLIVDENVVKRIFKSSINILKSLYETLNESKKWRKPVDFQ